MKPILNTDEQIIKALNQINNYTKISCVISNDVISFGIDGDGFSFQYKTEERKKLLREFFSFYCGKIMYYDLGTLKPLIRDLYMIDYYDYDGLLKGINILTKSFDDVKLIEYLATNSCQYVQDNKQLDVFQKYNKYYNTMVNDNQEELYETLFKQSVIQILHMELIGMPIDLNQVRKASNRLNRLKNVYSVFLESKLVELDIPTFNLNSTTQLQELLYAYLRLPIIDRTKTQQPSTSVKTIEKLLYHCKKRNHKMVLRCIIHLTKINKVLSSFIPTFLEATEMPDGSHRLFGNFHLGGTVSGRLSSSKPSLHQIPSGSTYASLIKKCFKSNKGKIFVGADYASLEDKVNALLTKDPNKIKIYTDGYDSHCYNTVHYYPEEFTHIDINNPIEVNSIKKTHYKLREDSKPITFSLTYKGTTHTLIKNCGLSKTKANEVYNNYYSVYSKSDEWSETRLVRTSIDGYCTLAFGLRLRTPLLSQVVWGSNVSEKVKKESRTVSNAFTQSYGLLTNKAANEFRERVLNSRFKNDIQIIALIHDAIYLEVSDRLEVLEFVNNNLIECMSNHNLPELYHDTVKLTANLEVFYPSWNNPIELENNISQSQIYSYFQ